MDAQAEPPLQSSCWGQIYRFRIGYGRSFQPQAACAASATRLVLEVQQPLSGDRGENAIRQRGNSFDRKSQRYRAPDRRNAGLEDRRGGFASDSADSKRVLKPALDAPCRRDHAERQPDV